MSVCQILHVCVSVRFLSQKPHDQTARNFMYLLRVARCFLTTV